MPLPGGDRDEGGELDTIMRDDVTRLEISLNIVRLEVLIN
jgi:hypothetical protein